MCHAVPSSPDCPHQTDATCIADGAAIFPKRIKNKSTQLRHGMAWMFLLLPRTLHDRVHCAPALDVFVDLRDHCCICIVMSLLRHLDDLLLELIEDVVGFMC